MATRVLLIGATGYIGGSVLHRLFKNDKLDITVLVRSASKAESFKSFGLKTALGSLDDLDVVERLASESHVVIQCANSDHLAGTQAILKGLEKTFEITNVPSVFIHTSGTAELRDWADGMFASETIYSDLDIEKIEALPATALHRAVDSAIADAGEKGYVRTHIVMNPSLWGIVTNEFAERKLQRVAGTGIAGQTAASVALGRVTVVGEGKNVITHLNVLDAAEFYATLLDAALSTEKPASGHQGYYFPENGEIDRVRISIVVARVLAEHGKVGSADPLFVAKEKVEGNFIARLVGANARTKGDRARALGWQPDPARNTDGFITGIEEEVKYWLKENAA